MNVSSVAGLHGSVGQINYASAKAAVIGMAKTICKEWGPFGVRANTVAFGYVQTRCVISLPSSTPSAASCGTYAPAIADARAD